MVSQSFEATRTKHNHPGGNTITVKWALLAVLLLVPSASAAINDSVDYQAIYPFAEGLEGTQTILSGTLNADLVSAGGTWGFFDAAGFRMTGIDSICWDDNGSARCVEGDVWLEVADGGGIGYRFPGTSEASITAAHALALFVDLSQDRDLNGFDVGTSVVASTVGGVVTGVQVTRDGAIATLTADTQIRIHEGEVRRALVTGKEVFAIEGAPAISDFGAGGFVAPFEVGSDLEARPATSADATEGLDPVRITQVLGSLRGASEQDGGGESRLPDEVQTLLADVLDGAILRASLGTQADFGSLTLVRLDQVTATADGNRVIMQGASPLWIKQGNVQGAPELVPGLHVPLWSLLLFALGIALVIARIATGAPRGHDTWDRYRIVGWLLTPIVFIALFWFWDAEMATVWGTSLLTGAEGEATRGTIALLQIGGFLYMMGVAVYPIHLILRNASRLARQGTFMALDRPVAMVLGFIIGAPLLLSFMQIVMQQVVDRLAG